MTPADEWRARWRKAIANLSDASAKVGLVNGANVVGLNTYFATPWQAAQIQGARNALTVIVKEGRAKGYIPPERKMGFGYDIKNLATFAAVAAGGYFAASAVVGAPAAGGLVSSTAATTAAQSGTVAAGGLGGGAVVGAAPVVAPGAGFLSGTAVVAAKTVGGVVATVGLNKIVGTPRQNPAPTNRYVAPGQTLTQPSDVDLWNQMYSRSPADAPSAVTRIQKQTEKKPAATGVLDFLFRIFA